MNIDICDITNVLLNEKYAVFINIHDAPKMIYHCTTYKICLA